MTPQLLVIKIQSLVNGASKVELAQLKLLASEYNKLHEQCTKRLEQCTALIKTNRDYLALELVESEPALLDTISIISFEQIEKWNSLCKRNGIETCPAFDEFQIDLLQSLYTKDIGQTHPLYRDYRRAMRMHNYRNALKIIGTISKINSQDYEIKQEYLRLLNSEITSAFEKLKEAQKSKNKEEVLSLYNFLESHKDDFNQEENNWESISESVKLIKKDDALVTKTEILKELKSLDPETQWALALSKIQELNFILAEYELDLDEKQAELLEAKQSIVEEKKKAIDLEKLKKNTIARTRNALSNENKKLPAKTRLSEYKKLREDKDLLDDKTLNKLNARISRLYKIVLIKLSTQAVFIAGILAAGGIGVYYVVDKAETENRLHQSAIRIGQIANNTSIENIKIALDTYKKDYADFLAKNELELKQIDSKIALQESYKAIADSTLAKLNALLAKFQLELAKTTEITREISTLEDAVNHMLSDDLKVYQIKTDAFKNKYNHMMSFLENEFRTELKDEFNKTENTIKGISSDVSEENIVKIAESRASLNKAKKLIEANSDFFSLHDMDKMKLEELSIAQLEFENDMNNFLEAKKLLASTLNIDEYFACLKKLQSEVKLSPSLNGAIDSILTAKQELKYGKAVENFTDEEISNAQNLSKLGLLESLPAELLELSEIYTYDNGITTVYTQGALKEVRNTWTGGYEIIQSGKEFSPRGNTIYSEKRKHVQNNRTSKDEIYTNEKLSKEAVFVNELQKEKHSLLKTINLIYNSDTDPIFKVWLESEIFKIAKANGVESGLLYSQVARERAELLEKNNVGISSLTWLRNDPIKKKDITYSLYSGELIDLEKDAIQKLEQAKALINTNISLVGFADENGNLNIDLKDYPSAKIYAMDRQGKEILLAQDGKLLTKAIPFSPLIIRD